MTPLTLASRSPRRRDLLESVGFDVFVHAVDVDEAALPDEPPRALAIRLARDKAIASRTDLHARGLTAPDAIVAADTVVWTDEGRALGKPTDADDARATLRLLGGRTHNVSTGWCVASRASDVLVTDVTTTRVTFTPVDDALLDAYLQTDEPWDKAGSYGIQGLAALFVARIDGSYPNVVGLPLVEVVGALRSIGRAPAAPWSYA